MLLAGPSAVASDVYSNIGPAPQIPAGGLLERYPFANYQLDQYFPAISVGLTSGVDVSGVAPLIAYFIAQVVWMVTAFLAYAVITVFAFAFSLDLLNGNGTPGSGALTPVSAAIHNLYASTFGAPWLVAMVVLVGCWAMWKALVQRRYAETAGALAVSLLYFVLAIGIVTQPERTIGPASKLTNQLSTSLLSLTNHGSIGSESQAKLGASNQLFGLLVLDPWTVLEFGGLEHCTTATGKGTSRSVAVRPLSASPAEDSRLAARLESRERSPRARQDVHQRPQQVRPALPPVSIPVAPPKQRARRPRKRRRTQTLPASDPGKSDGSYPLGEQDKPAAEAMGKGGQYQRLLLAVVIFLGELGAFLLLGALAFSVILAQILLLDCARVRARRATHRDLPRPRPRVLPRVAVEARGLPRPQGRLLTHPRRRPRRLPGARGRHEQPRMAAGVRAAGRVPVDRLPAAQPPDRGLPRRDCRPESRPGPREPSADPLLHDPPRADGDTLSPPARTPHTDRATLNRRRSAAFG